ncbi:MAG: beta-propeller fold lactonase family protein [Acidiferrobacter sp.]
MRWKAQIAGALLACTILSACQGPGGGASNSTAPTSGPPAPVSLMQCQAIEANPAATTTTASPVAPPLSGTIPASLILVPEGTHSLGVYLRDPWTGALVDRGYVPTGQAPNAVAVSHGQYVYVANSQDGTISAYGWQASEAQLTALGQGTTANTIASGPGVAALAITGNFLYALNITNSSLSTFRIENNGGLTLVSTITTPTFTTLIAGPNGLLYGLEGNAIVSYSAGSGPPVMLGTLATSGIIAGATNPSGDLFVLTQTMVTAYTTSSSGGLNAQDSVPLPSGFAPTAITAGNAQIVAVGNASQNTEVVTFPLNGSAIMCPTSAVLGSGGQANAASISPGGHVVYVTNTSASDLLAYTATTQGSGPQLTASVRTRSAPRALTSLVANVTISPQMLYVVNQSTNTIAGYPVATNGALGAPTTQAPTCSPCTTATIAAQGPSAVAEAPNGQNLYASDWAEAGLGDVTPFSIQGDGTLQGMTPVTAGQSPMGIAVDPSNRYLYVVNSCYENSTGGNCPGTISGYSLSQGTPSPLTTSPTVSTGLYPILLTIDPTGLYLYVTQSAVDSIGIFAIDPNSGALAAKGSTSAGTDPWTVVAGPAGRHLYVSDNGSGVSIYRIDAATGALSPATTPSITIPGNPLGLAIGPKGRRLYVATQNGGAAPHQGTVLVFTRSNPLNPHSPWSSAPLPLSGAFTNPYGLAVANNGKALYVVDNCYGGLSNNGAIEALAIPSFSPGLTASDYAALGTPGTGACSVEAVASGGLG